MIGLHQRRFAGAVVADQADHLAGLDRERDAAQRLDRAEMLAHVVEFEKAHRRRPLRLTDRARPPAPAPRRSPSADRTDDTASRLSPFCSTPMISAPIIVPNDGAAAAEQIGAAEDRRRDGGEFVVDAGGRIAGIDARHEQQAGQPGQGARRAT